MTKTKALLTFSWVLSMSACTSVLIPQTISSQLPHHANLAPDRAETSLDWAGIYQGILPCADCEGIQMTLRLNHDKSYTLDTVYLKNGHQLAPQSQQGNFKFDVKQSSLIHLLNPTDKQIYFIGEGYAELRQAETGLKIDSQLPYRLSQIQRF